MRFISATCLTVALALPASAQVRTRPFDPRAAEDARAGWNALEASRAEDALGHFDAAVARDPDVATYRLGAGLAAHRLGRTETARVHLEQALRLDPLLTPASVLLGLLLHREGDLKGAIRVYEDALARASDDPEIPPRLEAWRHEAALDERFLQTMSTNFTVLFEGPAEARLAQAALEHLESAYWRIGDTLGTYPTDVVTVVLYTNEQFRDITRSPEWAAGAYDGTIKLPVRGALEQPEELERVLAHELTHAFVHTLARHGVPRWLHEGLAGLFERSDLLWADAVVREADELLPLDRLRGDFGGFSSGEARLAYAESALATKYLIERAGAPSVVALLTDLGSDTPFPVAFTRRILLSYDEFQRDWIRQVR